MFVHVGQVAEHKGSGHVVEAIGRLVAQGCDVGCWILGACDSPWAQALHARVAAGPLASRIRFEGYVDDPTPWFAAADAHLAPSLADEAFGIVVAEAKAAGVPSIVYADGALPDLVANGVDGRVVARGDVDALAAAIRDYAADPALARRHGAAARESLVGLGIADAPAAWARLYGLKA
jgi:glycosyltransferase involved in cell wall biosynthesis